MLTIKFKKNHKIQFKPHKEFLNKKQIKKLEKKISLNLKKLKKIDTPNPNLFLAMMMLKHLFVEDQKNGDIFLYVDEDYFDDPDVFNYFIDYLEDEVKNYIKSQRRF